MQWYRMWVDARTDNKLRLLSDAQHRVWFNLLCYAAEQPERGRIARPIPMTVLAAEVAHGDDELLTATLQRLMDLAILGKDDAAYWFRGWDKRQFESDTSAGRVAALRKRRRDVTVTPCNGHVTVMQHPVTVMQQRVTPSESDTESESESDQISSSAIASELAATRAARPASRPRTRPPSAHDQASMTAVKDAIVAALGYSHVLNRDEWGAIQRSAALLLDSKITPEEVPRLVEAIKKAQPYRGVLHPGDLPKLVGLYRAAPPAFDYQSWSAPFQYTAAKADAKEALERAERHRQFAALKGGPDAGGH